MAQLLLQYGADINWVIDKLKGETILHKAVSVKGFSSERSIERSREVNVDLIRFLLENGANRYLINNKGKNSFELAVKHCNKEKVLEMLLNVEQINFYTQVIKGKREFKEEISREYGIERRKESGGNWMSIMAVCKK
jgi:hypothetical protein